LPWGFQRNLYILGAYSPLHIPWATIWLFWTARDHVYVAVYLYLALERLQSRFTKGKVEGNSSQLHHLEGRIYQE